MNTWVKVALYSLGVVIILVVAFVAIIVFTFDPNQYKTQIIALVKNETDRTLTLEGEIRLAVFPKLGIDISKVALTEKNSTEQFASVDRLRLYVALFPLLRKKIVVDDIRIDGMKMHLVTRKGGGEQLRRFDGGE